MISPWIDLGQKGLIPDELLEMTPSMAELRLLDEELG
jgi:hypothetical protein